MKKTGFFFLTLLLKLNLKSTQSSPLRKNILGLKHNENVKETLEVIYTSVV